MLVVEPRLLNGSSIFLIAPFGNTQPYLWNVRQAANKEILITGE
jgi:hypothetical protein